MAERAPGASAAAAGETASAAGAMLAECCRRSAAHPPSPGSYILSAGRRQEDAAEPRGRTPSSWSSPRSHTRHEQSEKISHPSG